MYTRSVNKMYFFLCSGFGDQESQEAPTLGACGSQPIPLLDKNALLHLCGLFPHRARALLKILTIFLSVLIVAFPLSFKCCILSFLIWGGKNNILILSMSLHLHLLLPHNW